MLEFAKENREGLFQQVRGLLADLLQVSVETAPLIEAALGEKAQYVVIALADGCLITWHRTASGWKDASDFCRSMRSARRFQISI